MGNRAKFGEYEKLDYTDLTADYVAINADGFLNPPTIFIMQNFTDVTVSYSQDGESECMELPSGGQLVLDLTTNHTSRDFQLCFSKGDIIYASTAGMPSKGSVNVGYVFNTAS